METTNETNLTKYSSTYERTEEVKKFDETKMGVKGLSDSGITSIPKFFIHPPQTLLQLKQKPSHDLNISIPIIDLANVDSPGHLSGIVHQIHEAASTWGFFQVINHGVSESTIESTIKAIKLFHDQPFEVKSKYYKREEGKGVMYASNNDLYRTESACWHDSLQMWMGINGVDPKEIPEVCRDQIITWDEHVSRLAEKVMELLSLGLGLEKGKFKELTFSESRALVGHVYPYCPQPDLTMGIVGHTDPGVLTVLLQNGIGGLQVKHSEYGWVDVKPLRCGLIINIGDFLQIVSNGEYKSVQHRVLANSFKEPRISIVEFLNLSKWREDGSYGPLPELLSSDKPPVYRDFTQQEFLDNFYGKGLDSKSFIDKITIRN